MQGEKPGRHQWIPVISAIITASAVVIAAYISTDAKRQIEVLKTQNEELKEVSPSETQIPYLRIDFCEQEPLEFRNIPVPYSSETR